MCNVFRICCGVSHRIGSLATPPGQLPQFGQLYMVDSSDEVNYRMTMFAEDGDGTDEANPYIVQRHTPEQRCTHVTN